MKKTLAPLILMLSLTLSNNSFGQIDVYITDLNNNKSVPFIRLLDTYNLNEEIPTLVITWSGKWCPSCIELVDRYNKCDTSMLNIITVCVDSGFNLVEVLKEGHHLKWDKTLNFHANIGKNNRGFDNVFNVKAAPLLLYLDHDKISDAIVNSNLYPYKLVMANRINDVRFIWNSPSDLNSLAWQYYKNETDINKLEEAKAWVLRSIELEQGYHNTDTYAALLFKTGEYTLALKTAKQAIEIAKEDYTDYSSTTDLINQIIEKL